MDGVLVAPGQGEKEAGYEVVLKATANPNNFTTFMGFISAAGFQSKPFECKVVAHCCANATRFRASLNEMEQSFFEQLLAPVTDLKDVPRLLFVIKRVSNVGLIFEGAQLHAGDLLDAEEQIEGGISIYEEAGTTVKLYTEELSELFTQNFPNLVAGDFILHRGVTTCLFACPALGLYTHGFEAEAVEPVVRFYINKLFELWFIGQLECTAAQRHF